MEYEPIFKLPYSNVFIINIFLGGYGEINPIVTLKNGKFEVFISKKQLNQCARVGFSCALRDGFFKRFKDNLKIMIEELIGIKDEKIEDYDKKQFVNFLERLLDSGTKFLKSYRITEYIYFSKIEEEISNYIKGKYSFEDVLSDKVDLFLWPESERKLADYIIAMQHLKFELRKTINDCLMGPDSIIAKSIEQLVIRTGREDAPCMTFDEIKNLLNGKEIKDVSGRHVYAYITWDKEINDLNIISGGDAYRKIREMEKEIPKNEVIGTVACSGYVKGKARIIPLSMEPEKYLSKMKEGEILVSDTTGPEMMVIIPKAKAIVTDEGGMMSHAAIVSREFGIPCVVGTSYATKVFKDGDLIEVNANNGVVRKIDSLD